MRLTAVAAAALFAILLIPSAQADEKKRLAKPALEMKLEIQKKTIAYGTPLQVDVVITNRTKKPVPFFHDHRFDGVLKITLVDRNGLVWRPIKPVIRLVSQPAVPVILTGVEHGQTYGIQPGKPLRLSFSLDAFIPADAPGRPAGSRWLGALAPGAFSVRCVYEKKHPFVVVTRFRPGGRVRLDFPEIKLRPQPGLFTGKLAAKAEIVVTAPDRESVDALRARIRELEAGNKRLRATLEKIRKLLPPK